MKLTQEKLILINRVSNLVTTSQTEELPVKLKVLALRNAQKIKPYQETYDALVSGITTKTLADRGFEKNKQYSVEEEKVFQLAIGKAVTEDLTISEWLKEEVEVDLVTVKLDDIEESFTPKARIDLVHALTELGIIIV